MISNALPDLNEFFNLYQNRVNSYLNGLVDVTESDGKRLLQAMNYSLLSGGKRIRPLLTYASALSVNTDITAVVDRAASAVECIHAYSLIHDDLPAMDDDHLRRGKPTCHIAFDQATAILAGDALQTLAFSTLVEAESTPETSLALISELGQASGSKGMVIGQMMDLAGANNQIDIEALERIHRHKTGALIEASVAMGAIAGGCQNKDMINQLREYAINIGLAFQVKDDILDVTTDTLTLGKQQGSDQALNKSTYVSLLGLDAAQEKCEQLLSHAIKALEPLGPDARFLKEIALYIVRREH